jgi:hypothetical protein
VSSAIGGRIAAREAVFEALVARAERAHVAGRDEVSARAAMTAAAFAWRCPLGKLAEPRLENVLGEIGVRCCVAGAVRDNAPAPEPQRILHLGTRADPIGGHTRILCRWIEADSDREHVVMLTAQGATPVPERLRRALSAGGSELSCQRNASLLASAQSVAEVAATCDRAVIHSAPSDVVPALALAGPPRLVPTVLVNHADHVFWLGTGAADVVAHLRYGAVSVSATHRGISRARSVVVPIPLDQPPPASRREAARAQLGVGPSDVLVLTIAAEYKFADSGGTHFLDAVLPAVESDSRIVVRAIGPRPIGRWLAAEEASLGRVRALGEQSEIADYYVAADIYLDSFPVPSFTSLLEAGQAGVPVVARSGFDSHGGYLELDELDGVKGFVRARSASEVTSALVAWGCDSQVRLAAGAALREQLRATHSGTGWLRSVEAAYRRAEMPAYSEPASTDPLPATLVTDLAEAHRRGGADAAYLSAVWKETPGGWASRLRELASAAWTMRRDLATLRAWAARIYARARVRSIPYGSKQ